MERAKEFFDEYIGCLLKKSSNSQIVALINIENMQNLHRFSVIGILIETVSLLSYIIVHLNTSGFWYTAFNVGCCIIACLVVVILSKALIEKYKKTGTISDAASNALVSFFYILLSLWGVLTDVTHYRNGEQMLTFYIVQFCFVCFIVMKPKIGGLLIALSFAALYLDLCAVDGAASIQPLNFIVFVVIAILGNAIKYIMLQESEKNKLEIVELNQILQQEVIIDDLTKIKNRRALDRDMEKYIGKFIYVIMADINHFKKYNDSYGHLVGDKVLSQVAALTQKTFTKGETYRYGGDEFLIVLSDCCTNDEYKAAIEKWKESVATIKIPNIATPITCSSGCSYGMCRTKADFRKCIKEADDRLYAAKKM